MFKKGQSGNPSGKPKGTKNKNHLSLRYWFEMISDNSSKLEPKEKVEIAFRAANMLLPKIQALPLEPGDSVDNAQKTLEMIKNLENEKPIEEQQNANG